MEESESLLAATLGVPRSAAARVSACSIAVLMSVGGRWRERCVGTRLESGSGGRRAAMLGESLLLSRSILLLQGVEEASEGE